MTLQIIWFILWGVLWGVYFMLDGFVLGAGTLHNVLAKTELEKRTIQRSFGPVWDGNEVWLVTGGGAPTMGAMAILGEPPRKLV